MTNITVLGATGFAGQHIVLEALTRGHDVTAASRTASEHPGLDGANRVSLNVNDTAALTSLVEDAEVVVLALSPRGPLSGRLAEIYRTVADQVARSGGRLLVVGGFSSLRPAPGQPRLVEQGMPATDLIPAEQLEALMAEAREMNSVLLELESRSDDLHWTFFSPGMDFGAHVPGERTGSYRTGRDGVVVSDEQGRSALSGADLAIAILDQVESPTPDLGHLAIAR